jgi:cellulose synthase/poly-beta-1,6-N-acetylglucosamine synthase-like glycosyltransferase
MIAPSVVSGAAGVLLDGAGGVVIVFFLLLHTAAAAALLLALPALWNHWDPATDAQLAPVLGSEALPTVSVVVTGRTDRQRTVDSLHALLALRYPRHEVVLVDDDEASGHLATLIEEFDLYAVPPAVLVNVPTGAVRGYYRSRRHGKLFVIDKPYAGSADDLNAAINASRFPYVLTMDVRVTLEPDALPRLMRPFLLGAHVAAVSGTVRTRRGAGDGGRPADDGRAPSGWLRGARAVERLRDELYARIGWTGLGGQLATHGGVLMHRRDHLLEIDGFRNGATDPELDLVVRLRGLLRAQQRSDAVPTIVEPVAWAPVPVSTRTLRERRELVHRGKLEALRSHGAALLSGRRGVTGLLAPLHLFGVAAVAPAMELAAYLVLGITLLTRGARAPFVLLFVLVVPVYAFLLSLWAVALDAGREGRRASGRDLLRLCAFAVAEQLGYRQWLMWIRLRATWSGLRGGPSGDAALPPSVANSALSTADQAGAR